MPVVVYLTRLPIVCSCGAPVVPDLSLPVDTILHECADCRILQNALIDQGSHGRTVWGETLRG
jgi:hypothetical protein